MANDFPWTPQHEQPVAVEQSADDVGMEEATEEVVPDSGDQATPEEAVVDKPAAKKPVVKKTLAKTHVKKARKAKK